MKTQTYLTYKNDHSLIEQHVFYLEKFIYKLEKMLLSFLPENSY